MSVREEDKKKSNCTSRGGGLAAAAAAVGVGVGVGAALYCFFRKGPENPGGEGSTTGWNCEPAHNLQSPLDQDDSYTTISENETSDTSMHSSIEVESSPSLEDVSSEEWPFVSSNSDTDITENTTDSSESDTGEYDVDFFMDDYVQSIYSGLQNTSVDSDMTEWDVTSSSLGVPEGSSVTSSTLYRNFQNLMSPVVSGRRTNDDNREERLRKIFRERSWSLEECSICFDVILKDQQVTTLPCTHHFHSACISPWLQEHQTCPNCRKAAE